MSDVRRISEFLPEVLQTDVLRKFFAATADHMFQPDRVEYLNAYVGQLPFTYDPNTDARVSESTPDRVNYQVEPSMVSRLPQSGTINTVLSYDDLINKLRYQGALVDDHNRLFQGDYYSWGLPVDLDKMVNYTQYVWLPAGPQLIQLLASTNLSEIIQQAIYTYIGDLRFVTDNVIETNQSLTFTTGLRVQFTQDINVQVRSTVYVVEGVGRQIRLVPDTVRAELGWDQPNAWDTTTWDSSGLSETPTYITIGRGSANGNPWSRTNRWFHKQVLTVSRTPLTPGVTVTAQRPILEFDYSIPLHNFGTQFLQDVTLVDTTRTTLNDVIDQTNVKVDHVPLDDGQIVLFTNLNNPNLNNRLYQVSNVRVNGRVALNQLPISETGLPDVGAVIFITQGGVPEEPGQNVPFYQNVGTNWYWSGSRWIQGQSRQLIPDWLPDSADYVRVVNQAPLFKLFDSQGESLDNAQKYPENNFSGCTLVSYAHDAAYPVDPVLGIPVVVDSTSARNYLFDVTCTQLNVQYYQNSELVTVPGYYYWQQQLGRATQFVNNWFLSDTLTRQYVINEYVSTVDQTEYEMDQIPATNMPGAPSLKVQVGARELTSADYQVKGSKVILNKAPAPNTVVLLQSYAGLRNKVITGYFEIPLNLQANPDNQQLNQFKISDILPHVHSVMQNQTGFQGDVTGINNWRDSAQLPGRGTHILQHRASMLKLMALNGISQSQVFEGSQSVTDPMATMQWGQTEYLRYYNKFVNALWNLYNTQSLTAADDVNVWMQRVMRQINLGKTKQSAWVNSGVDMQMGAYCSEQSVNPTWTPASATRLGATAAWLPEAYYDMSQPVNVNTGTRPITLRCHNGALVVLVDLQNEPLGQIANGAQVTSDPEQLTHPVARAWLAFERMQYDSMPEIYKQVDHVCGLDVRTIFSGKWRATSYSREDLLRLQAPAWNRWLTLNQVDALRNTTFDVRDPFSWNYGACVDADQQPVPGNWRGIYFYYYDTDEPHISPWHMLGFSQKPDWWDAEYGVAPYTRGNLKLWQDLADGRIRSGARQGVYPEWQRAGLLNCIPVNDVGELLPPFEAGVVTQLPSTTQASAEWKFGDRSPAENVWLTSVDADQLWAQWAYLARPAAFIEYLWDGVRQTQLFADQTYSQWVNADTQTRKPLSAYVMHRENPSLITTLNLTATYQGSCGIQHWFSEKLVSESRNVTQFLGDVIRGAGVNLLHKMGGFTDGDNLRVLVDSFGLGNVDNLLLPQEDVTTQLLRSASLQEYVYTGVLVEYLGRTTGWRVIGYDPVDPHFEIIPSLQTGAKQTVVVENQQVTEYKQGQGITQRVPYGTVFATRQQVYDFLISLGRAQEAAGWKFDEYDSTASRPRNWSLSAREFLYWSQGPWSTGTYITLSPLATMAKFETDFGIIQHIGGLVNGTHSVTDRLGNLISLANLDFLRIENEIQVKVLNDQGIYGLRLYTTSLEHALIFNNQTVFGDLIYDPVINQRQLRFKLFGYRTLNWQGRLQAPGYLVTQSVSQLGNNLVVNNRIIPNLEKTVNDLSKVFEIDLSVPYEADQSSVISQALPNNLLRIAQHQIGFQPRPYLTELLLDTSAEFQFYQGMIKQKGTSASIDALLRNTQVVKPDQEFYYFEEWAVRSGLYGYDSDVNILDVILPQALVTSNPQLVDVLSTQDSDPLSDNQITIVKNDVRIVNSSGVLDNFKLRDQYGSQTTDLPTAGPVMPYEVQYQVVDQDQLQSLYAQVRAQVIADPTARMIRPGDRVWQFVDPKRGWNVWKVCASTWQVVSTQPNLRDRTQTTVTTSSDHQLREGDLVILYGVVNAGVNINDTYKVITVWDSITFDIELSTTGTGTGGTAWQFASVRFASEAERNQAQIPGGWQNRDLAWVDGDHAQPWRVFITNGINWFEIRRENLKTDPNYVQQSRLYDLTSLQTLQMVSLWDPVKNKIPGNLDNEINYKTAYDPAQYTTDVSGVYGENPAQAWGEAQVGQVWWDLSTTRYLDYEMGSNTERRQNWGRIAPGTSIDVYEWVRSPVPPASWQDLVAAGADLTSIGSPGAASGQVKQTDTYVTRLQQTATGELQTLYYFWVRDSVTVPGLKNRQLSVRVISQALVAPENLGILWWAPISETQALIGNCGPYLNAEQTVWQIRWLRKYDVESVHTEYELVRPDDPRSSPPSWLWKKLGDSLQEYDAFGNPLPDPHLQLLNTQGVLTRPRQGVFTNQNQARQTVVQLVNDLLLNSDTPPLKDPSRQAWRPFFESEEPEPAQVNALADVQLVTTSALTAQFVLNAQTGTTELVGVSPGALVVDGVTCESGYRVLVKDQPYVPGVVDLRAQNGVYVVVDTGVTGAWKMQRASDLDAAGDSWTDAQVTVLLGSTQQNTVWNQTQGALVVINQDINVWQAGPAQPVYVQRVENMAQLRALDYTLAVGSQVLVAPDVTNLNKWTIWRWTSLGGSLAEWQLVRSQTYRTQNCWSVTDWYLNGYSADSLPDLVFDTLRDRDAFVGFQTGDLVRVLNTGNNTWAMYLRVDVTAEPWQLVGAQSASLELSDNLWNYAQYNLGFDAQGFGSEILGAEYDTRREFEQIWKGLWVNAEGTQGLLRVDNQVNEPNQVMFALVNQALSEQLFVDWTFKTSFINLRGFAEGLQPTELYTENKINSLIEYINEVKPYHVNVRSFVDSRKASETYTGNFTDFDKPPYADAALGVRILDEDNLGDQVILSTNPAYTAWYQNYVLNPELVRSIKTRMIYDRVSCVPEVIYTTGYSTINVPDITCVSLEEWLRNILDVNVPVNTLMQVHVPGYTLMIRNQNQRGGLTDWDLLPYGLDYQGEISDTLYDVDEVLQLLTETRSEGYAVRVYVDLVQTWGWWVKTENTSTWSDWYQVAYQAQTGATQRIQDSYTPTPDQPAKDSPGLISGCESKLETLSGSAFQTADAWDANAWDAVGGWDASGATTPDVRVNSGGNLKYQLFVGDATRTQFVLRQAPQQPTELQVWVDGRKIYTPQDWTIDNQISQALLVNAGLGYSMNDVLTIQGGQYVTPARIKVMGVSNLGAITQIAIVEPGVYVVAPVVSVLTVSGGTGIQATVTVRWAGTQLTFTQAPGVPLAPRPNIWVIEKGETFNPALSTLLDTTWDGAGLNRPHLEGGHPEELVPVWPRYNLMYDVYTAGTSGPGTQINQVYESDGVRTHFALPAPITENQQIWVFVNGELQTHGALADYVINYEQPQVVFVNTPAVGRVNIHQIGMGGATLGVADYQITQPGSGYQLYDVITLDAGVSTAVRPQVQVTVVKAVDVQIVQGGENYQVGDQLLYKFGVGTQTLVLQVTQIGNQAGSRGVVQQVAIVKPGLYTNLSVGIDDWFTTGLGTGIQLTPVWGVAEVFVTDRGAMLVSAQDYSQLSVTTSGGAFSAGTGFELITTQTHVLQQVRFQGDGATDAITLSSNLRENTLWVTRNGETILDYDISSDNDSTIVFRFTPAIDDVIWIMVYRSKLFSNRQVQQIVAQAATTVYTLTYPPVYGVAPTLNTQVFLNGIKLRAPHYVRYMGDGVQNVFALGMTVTDISFMQVWVNGFLQSGTYSLVGGGTQLNLVNTPAAGQDIVVQVTDTVVVNYDYVVSSDQITFVSGVLADNDQVEVITLSEDSSIQYTQDRFAGQMPAVYTLSRVPTHFGSVQVYVDGVKQDAVWAYQFVQVNNQTQIQFAPDQTHTGLNQIDVYYLVNTPAKPAVAFRMWDNLFGDTQYQRLSDARRSQITLPVQWNSEHVWVQDGAPLPDATPEQPGVIWLGAERVEYATKTLDAVPGQPRRHKLSGLKRGSLGTPTGVFSDLEVEFHNGDGDTSLFVTSFPNPIVKVNGAEQLLGVQYQLVQNPPGLVPGTYIQFIQTDQVNYVPPPGDRNVCVVQVVNSVISDQLSHAPGTWAQDASKNEQIPAGYIWPYGAAGIQQSAEPQTDFLIAEPGTRIR
jgi:hypothetical protein